MSSEPVRTDAATTGPLREEPATASQPALDREVTGMSPAGGLAARRAPGSGVAAGVALMLLGAWGALVAYVGPGFGYGPANARSWSWTSPHLVLNLIPGAAAFVAGLLCLIDAGGRRGAARMGGLLALGAGAWFVLGAAVYPIFYGTGAPDYAATGHGATASFVTLLGYGPGIGVAVCMLAGVLMALGPRHVMAARRVDRTPVPAGLRRGGRLHLRNTDPASLGR